MSLTNNTYALESLLNTANALPEAGTTVETCEVTISSTYSSGYPVNIAYTSVDSNGNIIGASQAVSTSSVTVTCVRGTTLAVQFASSYNPTATHSNLSCLFRTSSIAVFKLNDDVTTATYRDSTSHSGGSN